MTYCNKAVSLAVDSIKALADMANKSEIIMSVIGELTRWWYLFNFATIACTDQMTYELVFHSWCNSIITC